MSSPRACDRALGVGAPVAQLIQEFRESGIFLPAELGRGGRRIIEDALWTVHLHVEMAVRNKTEHGPHYLPVANRYFGDLEKIAHLIDRNRRVDMKAMAIYAVRKRTGWSCGGHLCIDQTERVMSYLISARREIVSFLQEHKPTRENLRNEDPLSHAFIEEMREIWGEFCCYPDRNIHGGDSELEKELDESEKEFAIKSCKLPREHVQPFARLLAAAWRDASLPVTNGNGKSREPLERWFADRVRKQKAEYFW
jgi:hypothetical protein